MLIDGVFGVEQALDAADRERDLDPVFCGGVLEFSAIDSIVEEPLVHQLQSFVGGLDELIHFRFREVLAVTVVGWVRNCAVLDTLTCKGRLDLLEDGKYLFYIPSYRWRSSSSNWLCLRPICNWIIWFAGAGATSVHWWGTEWVSLTT